MAVLSPPVAAVWRCPECGHGSPERRDEAAHLDAHRQLRAFFREWEAGTEQGQVATRSRRRLALVYALVALLVLAVTVTVFARINRGPTNSRPPAPAFTAPAGQPSQPSPPVASTPRTVPPAPPTTVAPAAARPAPARDDVARTSPVAQVPPPPQPPATPPATVPAVQAPPTPPHLLELCVLTLCITVL